MVVLVWSLEQRSLLVRDQEGVEVVNEFFGTFGPLGERWGWWRRGLRGWGGRRGAAVAVHRQGGGRSHAAQVPAVQGLHGQFIDRVLDISVAHREVPTVQTVQKTVLGVDVPVISSDRFPQSQRFESSCPRFSSSSEW